MSKPLRVLTIAGSAARGSAGIQADLKTFQELDVYGTSVITAIVARHPETDKNVHLQTIEAIEAQFDIAVNQFGFDGMKTGMLFSKEVIDLIAQLIKTNNVEQLIVDPVMVGKLNSKLLKDDAIESLKTKLIPRAKMITPNMTEASILLDDRPISTVDDLKKAAIDLRQLGAQHILVKGGQLDGPAVDVLYDGERLTSFTAPRIKTENTSGAGCSYSAAITAYLTKGKSVQKAVYLAKKFITTAIQYGFSYNHAAGPTYHAAERIKGTAHDIIVETV